MGRSLKSRFMEHGGQGLVGSEVSRHVNCDQLDHSISLENVRILEVWPKWFERGVQEAILIRINNQTLNKNAGRYNLPLVWNNTMGALGRSGDQVPGPPTKCCSFPISPVPPIPAGGSLKKSTAVHMCMNVYKVALVYPEILGVRNFKIDFFMDR